MMGTIQRNVGDFFLWGELRLTLICQRFQESTTTGEGQVSQQNTVIPTARVQCQLIVFRLTVLKY